MTFIPKKDTIEPSFNVGIILNKKATKGVIGIELEFEGSNLLKEDKTPPPWVFHHDGSLRGKDNAEYVLASPVEFQDVEKSLEILWAALLANKAKFDNSNRTSVHVHLNAQMFHLNRLASFLALYFSVEEVLTNWCGEFRVGNLFCLRAKDAPSIVTQVKKFIAQDGEWPLSDTLHYGGVNLHALSKFGSLEFRTMRGVTDIPTIMAWVKILERLYTLSEDFKDPRSVCDLFSSSGPTTYFDEILGPCAEYVRAECGMSDREIQDAVYEGIRIAQDICYCRDWDVFKPETLKPDPFGRDARKLAKRVQPVVAEGFSSFATGFPPTFNTVLNIPTSPNETEPVPEVFTDDVDEILDD